jgi:hypothetical protein
MNDDKALEDLPLTPAPEPINEAVRTPNGLPDPEPLRRAAGLLHVASAALAPGPSAALPPPSGNDLHRVVCACQELTTEWLEACGLTESRRHWLAWDALDILELIDMRIAVDGLSSLQRACHSVADLLDRLVRDCETAPGGPASRRDAPQAPADERDAAVIGTDLDARTLER